MEAYIRPELEIYLFDENGGISCGDGDVINSSNDGNFEIGWYRPGEDDE